MRTRSLHALSLLLLSCGQLLAQNDTHEKTTVASLAEDNYDVTYVKFDLNVSNTSTSLSGNVTTTATVVSGSLGSYVFELNPLLTIDSIISSGSLLPVTSSGVIRTAALPATLPMGASFTVTVYYHGTPNGSTTSYADSGINCRVDPVWGNQVTYTHSEPYFANQWWPCKQSLTDKIDAVDIWLTVPDTLMAGSNGLLDTIITVDAGHKQYRWQEAYPIAYQLIGFSVADYAEHSFYMHLPGATDSTLMQSYIYNNPALIASWAPHIDSTEMIVNYLSTLFGPYPFPKEKMGYLMAPLSGSPPFQTAVVVDPHPDGMYFAHQVSHQWFGGNTGCSSWKDFFLVEGVDYYTEYLYADHFASHAAAVAHINTAHGIVMTQPGGAVYVYDTAVDNIMDARLSGYKGASVLHMLRYLVNDDDAFFFMLRSYQAAHTTGHASLSDFITNIHYMFGEVINALPIDTFFSQWIYREGYPNYFVKWNQADGDTWLELDQTGSVPSSVSLFKTPLDIKIHSTTGDTIVHVLNDQYDQRVHFYWPHDIATISLDPEKWVLLKFNGFARDASLVTPEGIGNTHTSPPVTVTPNPTTGNWHVAGLPANACLMLSDVAGTLIWTSSITGSSADIPGSTLAPGMYILNIDGAGKPASLRLLKQ